MALQLIIGGGIAGLAAAWEAVRSGAEVVLVEASAEFGGKVRTERVDGLLIEEGPDSFVAYRPAALQLIDELGMSDELISVGTNRTVHLRSRGQLLPLPAGMGMVLPSRLGPFLRTRILTWPDRLRAALDLVLPRRLGTDDVSIGAFLRARLGDGIVRRFADPMLGGIYGAGVDELSLDAVLPVLREHEGAYRSLLVASLAQGRAARRAGAAARGPSSAFRSLRGGMGSLPERLVEALRASGADLRTGVSVTALRRVGGLTEATLTDGSTLTADAVVLAGGVRSSADLLAGVVPDAAAALRRVPLSGSTVVTLAYPATAFPETVTSHGWLEADPAPVSGVTISSAKWAGRAPEGTVLVRAFVPDRLGPIATAPDAELLAAVAGHLRQVLHLSEPASLTRITRWSGVMPKYVVGHLRTVAAVEAALEARPTWRIAGSALRGVGVPDCIANGRRATVAALAAVERP